MRHRLAALAALSALALALTATPALAGAVQRQVFDASDFGGFSCGPRTYAFTSGQFSVVSRDTSVAAHIAALRVGAVDQDGKTYRILGTETYDDLLGHLTAKLMVVSHAGGIVDSINIVYRVYPNGDPHVFIDQGTCGF